MKRFFSGFLGGALIVVAATVGAVIGGGVSQHTHSGASSGGSNLAAVPLGTILDYAGTSVPTNFKEAETGAAVSRTTCANLFAAIGTTWGAGDGSTTFNLPALARRVTVGSGGSGTASLGNAVGNTGGADTLTPLQLAAHTHSIPSLSVTASGTYMTGTNAGTDSYALADTSATASAASSAGAVSVTGSTGTGTSGSTGSGNTFNPPSAIVRKIIKADC